MPHACQHFWNCYKTFTFRSLVGRCRIPCACHAKPHLNIFSTSKSAPNLTVFNTFDLKMLQATIVHFFRHLNFQKDSEPDSFSQLWLRTVLPATMACTFSTAQLPKSAPRMVCCYHSGFHNGVLFDISTSKRFPNLTVFHSFDFEMCFQPQWRALFQQLNFQKCSENGVLLPCWLPNVLPVRPQWRAFFRHLNFQKRSEPDSFSQFWLRNVLPAKMACTFSTAQLPKVLRERCAFTIWLPNVLPATKACFFSTSQLPKVPRTWQFFTVLTSKRGVQFFISHLASLLSEPQSIGKTKRSAAFLLFRTPVSAFFWLFLFSELLSSAFLLPGSSHLCFSSVHTVRSLTSKLPSILVIISTIGGKYLRNSSWFAWLKICLKILRKMINLFFFTFWHKNDNFGSLDRVLTPMGDVPIIKIKRPEAAKPSSALCALLFRFPLFLLSIQWCKVYYFGIVQKMHPKILFTFLT